jgi:FkbM family methyltransferase
MSSKQMLVEGYFESALRWHLYRRWKNPPRRTRELEWLFHTAARSAPRGSIFLDCGANVGDISVAALKHKMKVIAFEPDLNALRLLKKRFDGVQNVEIIPKAVGNSDRTANFFQNEKSLNGDIMATQASSFFRHEHAQSAAEVVEVVDIVKFIRNLDAPIGILKMDIEGAEIECLDAILDAGLHTSIGQILVETHERFSEELATKTALLRHRIQTIGATNINLDWI